MAAEDQHDVATDWQFTVESWLRRHGMVTIGLARTTKPPEYPFFIRCSIRALCVVLALAGCGESRIRKTADCAEFCSNHLKSIAVELALSIPTAPEYPQSLASLSSRKVDAGLFVCPCTDHVAGELPLVEEWSDYIYVANLPDVTQEPRVAILICPPMNHNATYGYVVWLTREIERLASQDIEKLIKEPWCFATNAPAHEIERLKRLAVVRVPKRFRQFHPGSNTNVSGQ